MKFNKQITELKVVLIISLVMYVAGTISNSNFNISQWGEVSRDFIALAWGVCTLMYLLAINLEITKD